MDLGRWKGMTNEEAIKTLEANYPDACFEQLREAVDAAIEALKAQDADSDTISRKAAIDAILAVTGNSSVRELYEHVQEHGLSEMWSGGVNAAIDIIIAVPSAQPEHTNSWYINSWCIDCKEYDTENKCCPRYNRVIKQTLDDAYRHGETEAEARFHDEIVRCEDCKYNSNTCGNYVNCDIIPQMFGRTVDNFCSIAKRKEGTDESD